MTDDRGQLSAYALSASRGCWLIPLHSSFRVDELVRPEFAGWKNTLQKFGDVYVAEFTEGTSSTTQR